ncbi:uncharacterized protein [Rutidosis leptorrhynchoides]|uniref:uncharacterized protein n=1 Tax=Rutidosis leptorrhynchoides TaxID=125765 RepID=UPI003A9A14C3
MQNGVNGNSHDNVNSNVDIFWKNQKTHFTSNIQYHPLPSGMTIPSHLGYYERKDDPDNYMNIFEGASRMLKWEMDVACHAFSYMHKSDARIWFDSLAKDSITIFNDLKRLFKSKFSHQKRHKKNHVDAHNIKQKDNEGLPETQSISRLLYGCRTQSLIEHISREIPDTYEALLDKAYVWLDAKKTAGTFAYEDHQVTNRKEKLGHRKERHGRREERNREILSTEKAAQAFKAPPKLANKGKQKDTSKFCDFHNDYRHEIDECIQLRIAIEEVVRSGKLSHMVKGIRNPRAPKTVNLMLEDKKPKIGKEILAIDSYFAIDSRRYYKRERPCEVIEWEKISFPALDTITSSEQAVTINGLIFDREVHRVYLDCGSSFDIMYEYCSEQLNPSIKAHLMPLRVPLVGFSGERCWPIGEINFDFTIGQPPMTRTETLDFVIVNSTSQHNSLLGRVAMRKMGIILSTVHQLVKFHTTQGIATLASAYDRNKVVMAIKETTERLWECVLGATEESPQG